MDDYIRMAEDLVDAKERADLDRIRQIVERGDDVRAIDYAEGWTLLHWASHHGHTELARMLLDRGADPEIGDEEGQTSLMLAASAGHLDTVHLLLDRGANPAAETRGMDAADFARLHGHTAIQLVVGLARKKVEPVDQAASRARSRWERNQAQDARTAVAIFQARPEDLASSDPLVGVWQDIGKAMILHDDGTVGIVSHGGRSAGGPLTRWTATEDGEFVYDSTALGPGGRVSRHRWRLSEDKNKLFLTNEFGGVAEFQRRSGQG